MPNAGGVDGPLMRDDLPRSQIDVRNTFQAIAEDFDQTRQAPWPPVERFVTETSPDKTALDLGCGNGRHSELLLESHQVVYGIDISRAMLTTAIRRFIDDQLGYIEASATAIPLQTDSIHLALYIATIHHLPDRSRRVASLDELERVLQPGSKALVSAWSVRHERFSYTESVDTVVDWVLPSGDTVERFYHLYDVGDFVAEVHDSSLKIERHWVESGNCYAVVSSRSE